MAFQHDKLGLALGWKFNHQPGMSTRNGGVTQFPGGIPADNDLAQWVAEFEALPADDPAKDRKADLIKRTRAATSVPELRAIVEELIG